jgi:sugar lactone lactonase YvrE
MNNLREELERKLPLVSIDEQAALSRVHQRLAARRRRRRLGAVAIALVFLVVATAGVQNFDGPSPSLAAEVDTALGGPAVQVETGLGSIWISICQRRCQTARPQGQLLRVDLGSGRIITRFPITNIDAFAIGDGSIWLADAWTGQISRLDPRTGRTEPVLALRLPKPIAGDDRRFLASTMTARRGTLWVGTARGWLARISEQSGRLVSLIRAPAETVGPIAAGSHGLWVAESEAGIGRVPNGSSLLTAHAIRVGAQDLATVDELAVGGNRVWIYGLLARPAPASPVEPPAATQRLTLTSTAVFATLSEATGRVIGEVTVPAGAYQLLYGAGTLIAADFHNGSIFRVTNRGTLIPLPPVHGAGKLVAVTANAIWATTSTGILRRIRVSGA